MNFEKLKVFDVSYFEHTRFYVEKLNLTKRNLDFVKLSDIEQGDTVLVSNPMLYESFERTFQTKTILAQDSIKLISIE